MSDNVTEASLTMPLFVHGALRLCMRSSVVLSLVLMLIHTEDAYGGGAYNCLQFREKMDSIVDELDVVSAQVDELLVAAAQVSQLLPVNSSGVPSSAQDEIEKIMSELHGRLEGGEKASPCVGGDTIGRSIAWLRARYAQLELELNRLACDCDFPQSESLASFLGQFGVLPLRGPDSGVRVRFALKQGVGGEVDLVLDDDHGTEQKSIVSFIGGDQQCAAYSTSIFHTQEWWDIYEVWLGELSFGLHGLSIKIEGKPVSDVAVFAVPVLPLHQLNSLIGIIDTGLCGHMDLSVIFACRNDDYGGMLEPRMYQFLKSLSRSRLRIEVIAVEWNPVSNTSPMHEVLQNLVSELHLPYTFRVITVPRVLHHERTRGGSGWGMNWGEFQHPMLEYAAKNVGGRRARGRALLFTNPDVYFTTKLLREMEEWFETVVENDLDNDFYVTSNRYDVSSVDTFPSDWYPEETLLDAKLLRYKDANAGRHFSDGLSLGAAGDFTWLSAQVFVEMRGYVEMPTISYHDSLLLKRLKARNLKEHKMTSPLYHFDHKRAFQLTVTSSLGTTTEKEAIEVESFENVDSDWGCSRALDSFVINETIISGKTTPPEVFIRQMQHRQQLKCVQTGQASIVNDGHACLNFLTEKVFSNFR